MNKNELYAYTTNTYRKNGLVKVGNCIAGRHKERIKEQFGTSNPEKPEYVLIGELPDGVLDRHIHAQLIRNGNEKIEDSPGKEWFRATFNEVRRAYHQVVDGESRTLKFSLRQEQKDAVEKSKKWFEGYYQEEIYRGATHRDRFLLNAKMRFGKCFTSMHLAKALQAQNVLIITYKPDVIDEWIDTINEQVDFSNWIGVRAKKKRDRSLDPCLSDDGEIPIHKGPLSICVSLQDLSVELGRTKQRLGKILEIHWDLIIFDEVHYGSRTKRTKYILDNLNYAKRLDLSGTPFRIIEQDDLCAQQVYTYSYLDEQKNKHIEQMNSDDTRDMVYRQMPDLNISTIEITDEDIQQQCESFRSDDLEFSLNRLFETLNGYFIHEAAVDHFLDGLVKSGHDARSVSVFGKLGSMLGVPATRHTVWWLNRVDSVKALTSKLKSHTYFSKFKIINAAGGGGRNEGNLDFIAKEKSIIEKCIQQVSRSNKYHGTITLTCGRFLTGITVKEWDSVLVLNDVQSAESYFQAIFRVQSAWYDVKQQVVFKPKAWVFDFAISRCLKIVYDCAISIADQIDQQESYEQKFDYKKDNLETTVAGLCESLSITRFMEGNLTSIPATVRDIFDILDHGGSRVSLARRVTSNMLVNFDALKILEMQPHIVDILNNIKGYRTQEVSSLDVKDLVQIGIDAELLKDIKEDEELGADEKERAIEDFMEKDKDKNRQTRKKWYATQIKRLAICMADFIYMTYEREYNIYDVIETKSPRFFEVMTGISKDDFKELCEYGFLNKLALNRIVREFHDQEEHSLAPEQFILVNLGRDGQ